MKVVPRARRTEVAGTRGDALLVRLAAPPVDGAANEALIGFLADLLGCRRVDVRILSGGASRTKRVAITETTPDELATKLSAILRA